jgi:hypothetical protein
MTWEIAMVCMIVHQRCMYWRLGPLSGDIKGCCGPLVGGAWWEVPRSLGMCPGEGIWDSRLSLSLAPCLKPSCTSDMIQCPHQRPEQWGCP